MSGGRNLSSQKILSSPALAVCSGPNANGVASSSPGLPEPARATLGRVHKSAAPSGREFLERIRPRNSPTEKTQPKHSNHCMPFSAEDLDVFCLEDTLWLATRPVGVPIYDFA